MTTEYQKVRKTARLRYTMLQSKVCKLYESPSDQLTLAKCLMMLSKVRKACAQDGNSELGLTKANKLEHKLPEPHFALPALVTLRKLLRHSE